MHIDYKSRDRNSRMVASIFSVAANLSVPDPCDTEEGMCHFVPTNGTFGIAKVQKNIFINVKR